MQLEVSKEVEAFNETEVFSLNQIYERMQTEESLRLHWGSLNLRSHAWSNQFPFQKAPNEARRLLSLNEIKWDTEKLLEILFEGGQKAGTIKNIVKLGRCSRVSDTCLICYDCIVDSSRISLSCKHNICRYCLTDFVTLKVESGQQKNVIKCPVIGCEWELDDQLVFKELQTEQLKSWYLRVVVDNFVQVTFALITQSCFWKKIF